MNHQKSPLNLFGTDGVRGTANVFPMTPDLILKLGQAIGIYFRSQYQKPRILIGKDTRRSGYMLEQALSAGISSVGVDTYFLGPLPTPGIAYLTRGLRANAGIVISASHNPFYDNGIKIFSSDGYKLPDQVELELEKATLNGIGEDLPVGKGLGRSRRVDDAIGQYAVFLKEQLPKHLTLDGLRLVVDCANGSAYKIAPKVFEELGAEVFVTGVEPNGFNINEQCGAMHPQNLVDQVKLYKADLGIALDGDADRLVLVDHRGEIVDGDEIMAICGSHLLSENKLLQNTVVATVMSNMGLELSLARFGGKIVRTKVGDRYVVEEMRRGQFNFGGEQSGHLVFRDQSTTGDGILAALSVLEILIKSGKSLFDLKKVMEKLPQVLKNISVREKVPLELLTEVNTTIENFQKKLGKEGRILFRYSGTEEKARIMVEGSRLDEIETMADELALITQNSIEKLKSHSV
jgi:phosphoglucosamine mutase